jgi:hypothetical protein
MKELLFTLLFTCGAVACGQNNAAGNNGRLPGEPEYYADGEVITLHSATQGAGVPIVMVGEGFGHNDLSKGGLYERTARELAGLFLGLPVYRDLREYFNIYALCVESVDSGVDIHEDGKKVIDRNTRFGMPGAYSGPGGKVFEGIKKMVSGLPQVTDIRNTVVIMINNGMVGGFAYPDGTGFGIAVYSTPEGNKPYWMMHEFGGHVFGRLADEYFSCPGEADDAFRTMVRADHAKGQDLNTDVTNDPAQVAWAPFIGREGYEQVGFYEGGHYVCTGVWRPEEKSVMSGGTMYYNAPSRYLIWKRIKMIAGEPYDVEDFFAYDRKNL